MGNIGGWIEDAEAALERVIVEGPSKSMPQVEVRSQLVPLRARRGHLPLERADDAGAA